MIGHRFQSDRDRERADRRLQLEQSAQLTATRLAARNAVMLDRFPTRLEGLAIDVDDWEAWYRSGESDGHCLNLLAVAGFWTLFAAFPMQRSLPDDAAGDTHCPLNQTQALAAMAHAGDITVRLLDHLELAARLRFEPFDSLADNIHYATLRAGWCAISFWWADINEVRARLAGTDADADEWRDLAEAHRAEFTDWLQRISTIFRRLDEEGEAMLLLIDDRAFALLTGKTRPKGPDEDDGWPWPIPRI